MAKEINKHPVQIVENTTGITVDGKTFTHMRRKWVYEIHKLILSNGESLKCTATHRLKLADGTFGFAEELKPGVVFSTGVSLVSIQVNPYDNWVYDLVEIETNEYLVKGIISHNCEFQSSDALLVNSRVLIGLKWEKPLWESLGFKFWVPEEELGGRGKIYMLALDPATGSGNDFSAIEIFDFPGLNQVAEYRTNNVNIPLLYAKLTWILKRLSEPVRGSRAEVLWTFERNGVGEAISALYFNDEDQVQDAELVNDHPSKFGVFTHGTIKIVNALQMKTMIEKVKNGLNIKSEDLISELKNFVARGGTYAAKTGTTDDSVMATILIMRLMKRLSEYNEDAFDQVNEYVDADTSLDDGNFAVPFSIL